MPTTIIVGILTEAVVLWLAATEALVVHEATVSLGLAAFAVREAQAAPGSGRGDQRHGLRGRDRGLVFPSIQGKLVGVAVFGSAKLGAHVATRLYDSRPMSVCGFGR